MTQAFVVTRSLAAYFCIAMEDGLQKAIAAAGSQSELARRLGITPQAVQRWCSIPARHIIAIERVTGVPREVLRPELYRCSPP